jgi:hypothetical protein
MGDFGLFWSQNFLVTLAAVKSRRDADASFGQYANDFLLLCAGKESKNFGHGFFY